MSGAARYSYTCVGGNGALERGSLAAPSLELARRELERQGRILVSLKEQSAARGPGMTPEALATGLATLAELLDANLTIARALSVLESTGSAQWKGLAPAIKHGLREGLPFSAALAASGCPAPAAVIGLLRAGDLGHGNASAVRRAAEHLRRTIEARRALATSLAYPAILAVIGATGLGTLLWGVLPRFARMIEDVGQPLPASSALLLQGSQAALAIAPLGFAAAVAAGIIYHRVRLRPNFRLWRDRIVLNLQWVGAIRHRHTTATLCETFAALIDGGVPLGKALEIAAAATADAEVASRARSATASLRDGERLSVALRTHRVISEYAAELLRAGEESGKVHGMLVRAAETERQRVAQTLAAATRVLEPALLVGFAVIIGVVASGLLKAVYAVKPI